ncbi:wd40 repeat-containing protein [Leptolyngbya sp. Heron Island J]|uniref:WD40 repeat domain-containing protein n=1 Tax=Leptolyngbya sp. Heron Island J TaxID=1385935 RepID=UPI0003B9C628|nr:WD40 repeat domain-containing protein [Leptolyngbya sp. Heron Island J]ESA34681.1 wd40 repeat-containing protein [Leptolyngbya sp. Heron Island J]
MPIVRRDGFDMPLVHPDLGKANWLFFQADSDFDAVFQTLVKTLNTDLTHVKAHTKLLVQALEWEHKDKTDDILLRGGELDDANRWLQQALVTAKHPVPTPTQLGFIQASQALADRLRQQEQAEQQRQLRQARRAALTAIVAGLIMAGLALFAFAQKRQVETVQESQINALSRYSLILTESGNSFDGLLEALRAGQQLRKQLKRADDTTHSQVLTALQTAVYQQGWREHNRLTGHTNDVERLAISPDGQLIASASRDHSIRLWDQQGQGLYILEGHDQTVTNVTFSSDGQMLASTSADRTVKLWTLTGELIRSFRFDDKTNDVSFSPDGERVAIATNQQVILLTLDGEIIQRFRHKNWVNSVEFSADGQRLLTATEKAALLWTLEGKVLQTLSSDNWVNMAQFSPHQPGQTPIIAAAGDKAVQLWTTAGEELEPLLHDGWVNSVRFSPDGQTVVTTDSSKQILLWDLNQRTAQVFPQDRDMVDAVFTPDSKALIIASRDNVIRLWRRGEDIIQPPLYQKSVDQLALNQDGSRVATRTGSTLELWSNTGERLQSWPFENALRDISVGLWSRGEDSEEVLAIASQNQVQIQTLTGDLLHTWDYPAPVNSVDISPDGTLVVVTTGTEVSLVSATGEVLKILSEQDGVTPGSAEARFSPDGSHVAIRSYGTTLQIWHLADDALTTLTHDDTIHTFSFRTGETPLLASGSDDNTLRLWSLDGTEQTRLNNETTFNQIRFSADGQYLAAVDADNRISLWTVNHAQLSPLIELVRHRNGINDLGFHPESTHLVSAGADEQVIVWDLAELSLAKLMGNACQVVNTYLTTNRQLEGGDRKLCEGVNLSQ